MTWRFAWALVLTLLAAPAFALGLGQIQVRSQHGEPLLAEIPIVSSDANELRQLRVGLASPDTFARVGLQPPQGLVRELQFNVALDASGRPVVRVTSAVPVDQSLLTFLIEADWGQGRLVREYSALLDAPDAIAAAAQPAIQAPEIDAGDRIVRPEQAPPEPAGAVADEAAVADAPEASTDESVASVETVATPEQADASPAAPPPAPAPPPQAAPVAAVAAGSELAPVQAGETLSGIAAQLASQEGVSTNQMMLALLRTNPSAFIGDNINLLREGAVLRVPDRNEVLQQSAVEATAEVRSHVARWREMSAPRPQPVLADADGAVEQAADEAAAAPADRASAQASDARLEIAPPSATDGRQAGTTSGIAADGEGETLRQELQETRETLAARDAEVEELRTRLAELEQLQGKQQQLIELKDSELAAVQQRLAESNQQAAPTLAQANQPVEGAPEAAQAGGAGLWIGLGLVLILAAAIVWARSRRKAGDGDTGRPGGRQGAATPAWHAGGTAAAASSASAVEGFPVRDTVEAGAAPAVEEAPAEPVVEPAAAPVTGAQREPQPQPGTFADPVLDAVRDAEPGPSPSPSPSFAADFSADPVSAPEPSVDAGESSASDLLTGAGERLELAKAYVELGDVDTARDLLREVVGTGDAVEAAEARRLLAELA